MKLRKYKAWNILEKRMMNSIELWAYPYGEIFPHTPDQRPFNLIEHTGFPDKHGNDIYEGDILSDWNEVDGEMVQSKMQVFWCDKTGAWKLDNSYKQDKSSGDLLSDELADFAYEITGNIYETTKNV